MDRDLIRTSKFLSLVLRHSPERIGLKLEPGGWASVEELLRLANAAGRPLTDDLLFRVVRENDKQRFALTPDRAWIRANQGHSIDVDLGLASSEPPEILYHGTAERNLESILRDGLLPGRRQHVHLSPNFPTALKVGKRHGSPVVLVVESRSMYEAGGEFFRTENGVWLTLRVAPRYIRPLPRGYMPNMPTIEAQHLNLREVTEADLPTFFAFQLDPDANHMAAFTAKDPADREAFDAHWRRIMADPTVIIKTIVCDGQVVGSVLSYEDEGKPEVSYWIGKAHWGKGIATQALAAFLAQGNRARPIYARVAKDNLGSYRVLEKCGFTVIDDTTGFANARGEEIAELLLELGGEDLP